MEMQLQTKDTRATLHLDPRTKLYLLIVGNVALFLAPSLLYEIALVVCVVILGILVGAKRFTVRMAAVYAGMVVLHIIGTNYLTGTLQIAIVTFTVFIRKIFPCAMLGGILVSTTRVNEFMAAMNRIHMPKAMVIPLTVMLRYFPMVHEDWGYISDAMRMRGVRLGGGKASSMLEFRLVPLLMSSVKIGDELSAAALTRGLGAPARRTNVCRIGFHAQDAVVWAVCLASLACFAADAVGVL